VYEYFDFPAVGENIHRVTTANQPATNMNKKGWKKEDGWVSDDRVRTMTNEYIKKNN